MKDNTGKHKSIILLSPNISSKYLYIIPTQTLVQATGSVSDYDGRFRTHCRWTFDVFILHTNLKLL